MAFSGSVAGYATATTKILGLAEVPGLKVQIDDRLLCPQEFSIAEAYLFGVKQECSPRPWSIDELHREYPIGRRVTVVGSPLGSARSYFNLPLVLLCHADGFGFVARVPEEIPREKHGLLDLIEFKKIFKENSAKEYSIEIAYHNAHMSWYEDYEYLRCLIKLNKSLSKEERYEILLNMAGYSDFERINPDIARRNNYAHLVGLSNLEKKSAKLLLQRFDRLLKNLSEH